MLPELGLVLDAGTAAFRVAEHVETERLDVLLTHAHLDHVIGLTHLLGLERGGTPVGVTVHGREETLAAVRGSLFDERLFPVCPVEGFAALGERLELPGGATVTTFPLNHPGGSVGMRIDADGRSLAYVTDTTAPEAATIDRLRGVDVLVHEAYFTEDFRDMATLTGHSTAKQAAETAIAAGAGRLLLVHRDPRADDAPAADEAKALFTATELATDGLTIDV